MDQSTRISIFFKYSVIVLLFCVPFLFLIRNNDDNLVVELVEPNGKIRGHVLKSAKGRNYYAFQQIPYGKPPIGENRYNIWHAALKPPKVPDGWEGILDCTKNTRVCVQFAFFGPTIGDIRRSSKREVFGKDIKESEDCLYLNVYTPAEPGTNRNLSVYFFVHGGAMAFGGAIIQKYAPTYLMDGDVVVITMNYRVGPLGFLSTGDHVISGNMGLKDQHLALQWTRKNVHLFGGNPNDIVVGGGSSGAFCVGYHLLSSANKGLVTGFIQQSGSHLSVDAFSLRPRDHAFQLGKALDPTISDNTSSLAVTLRKASAEELVKAATKVSHPPPVGFMYSIIWEPVIEDENGEETFITSPIYEDMMKGNFNRVPSFLGFNSEESLWFLSSDESALQRAAALFDENPNLLINPAINVENKTLVAKELKKFYTHLSFQEDPAAFIKYTSDASFIRSILRQADIASKYIPVYLYQLSVGNYKHPKYKGIAHVIDMMLLWELPPYAKVTLPVDEEVREIALRLWWNFIKYKNPTPERDPVLQNILWPTVEPGNLRYLNLNKRLSIETNPRNYNNMKNVLLKYMKPPFYVF